MLGIPYERFVSPATISTPSSSSSSSSENAIRQIDFALEAEGNEGKTPYEAIYQRCLIRFRPIAVTTMCALLGALPIAIGERVGGESRPLGLMRRG